VQLIHEVRAEIKGRGIKVDSEGWQNALDVDSLIELLRKDSREKAKNLLLTNLTTLQTQRTSLCNSL
jgi:hypothetical protein